MKLKIAFFKIAIPYVCHQSVLQLLNDLPIANYKDNSVKMLTQVDLIMAAAKLSL